MADQTRPDETEAKRRIRRGVVALVAGLMFSAAVTFLALPHLVSVLFINPTVEGTVVSQPVTRCSGSSGNRSCTTFAEVRFRTLEGEIIEKRTNVKSSVLHRRWGGSPPVGEGRMDLRVDASHRALT